MLWKDSVNHLWSPPETEPVKCWHVAPHGVENSAEMRMSAIEQLDELIGSVRKNVQKLREARDQAATLAEAIGKRLDASAKLLDVLSQVREKLAPHGDVALEAVAAQFDQLRDLLVEKPALPAPPSEKAQFLPANVVEKAKEVLLETKRPMKRGQLVRVLEMKGVALAGKDKNKNLGTILWRNPRIFVSIEGLGYWVKGVPLDGVYDPERDDEPLPKTTFVPRRKPGTAV